MQHSKELSTTIGEVGCDSVRFGSCALCGEGVRVAVRSAGDGTKGGWMVWASASTSDPEAEGVVKTAGDGVKIDAVVSSILDTG